MNKDPRGFVDLNNIDNGITALLLNYSYSGSKNYDRKSNGSNKDYLNWILPHTARLYSLNIKLG